MDNQVLVTNDAIVFGLLAAILGLVFYTSSSGHHFWRKFYKFVPALFLCYFLPSLLNTFGVIDGNASKIYSVAKNYLLPASLVLLTLSIDMKKIVALGPKAIIMFLVGTLGIVIGGPLAILIFSVFDPNTVAGDVWRGMATLAGSWIGGGANQAAMKEIYNVGGDLFSVMIAVDVVVANIWMAVLLYMAGESHSIDKKIGADVSRIDDLKLTVEKFEKEHARIPLLKDLMIIVAIAFTIVGAAHLLSQNIAPWIGENAPALKDFSLDSGFFWLIVLSTTGGLILSFTRARQFEGAGASKVGSVFIYVLVASIGMHMNIAALFDEKTYKLFIVGLLWMAVHAGLLLTVARLIRAPTFFMAVGSQANVGGAASAPVVASAFHPSLAPVGVLLAVLGYALGTYAAYFCSEIMRVVAPAGLAG